MRRFVASGMIAVIIVGCSDSGTRDPELSAEELVGRAIEFMNDLDSYHARFVFAARPEDARDDYVWEFDLVPATDEYRVVIHSEEGPEEEICESRGTGTSCWTILTSVTGRTRIEGLYVGDGAYGRQCDGDGENCSDWERGPRPELPVFGPSATYMPHWPIVALELAEGLALEAGSGEFVVSGFVNLMRAILENERRVAEAAGVTVFGRECTVVQVAVDNTPRQGDLEPTEVCRDTTYEDLLEREADDLAAGDANPAPIEARFDPETYHLLEFESSSPVQDDGAPGLTFRVEYSGFDDVTIEIPEEFR